MPSWGLNENIWQLRLAEQITNSLLRGLGDA